MNSMFRSIIFTLVGLAIFFAISWFFISIVPYILLIGLIVYIIAKVRKHFIYKNDASNDYNIKQDIYENSHVKSDYYKENEKIIDVDYKEMDEN